MQSVNQLTNYAQFPRGSGRDSERSQESQPFAVATQLDGIRAQLRQMECRLGLHRLATEKVFVGNAALEERILAQEERSLEQEKKINRLENLILRDKDLICQLYQRTHVLEDEVTAAQASERTAVENLANMKNEVGLLKEEMKRAYSCVSSVSSDVK